MWQQRYRIHGPLHSPPSSLYWPFSELYSCGKPSVVVCMVNLLLNPILWVWSLSGYCYHPVSTNYNNEWQSPKSNANLLDFKANDHNPFAVLTLSPHGLANSWQSSHPSLGFQGMEFSHLWIDDQEPRCTFAAFHIFCNLPSTSLWHVHCVRWTFSLTTSPLPNYCTHQNMPELKLYGPPGLTSWSSLILLSTQTHFSISLIALQLKPELVSSMIIWS